MTNSISIVLALSIFGLFAADYYYLHWDLPVFIGRQLMNLIEYLAIWR